MLFILLVICVFQKRFTYFADMTGVSFIIFIFLFASGTNEILTIRQVLAGEELLLAGNMMKKYSGAIKKVLSESTVNPMASLACECGKTHLNCLPCFHSYCDGLCDIYS